jgi:hypothetical protein
MKRKNLMLTVAAAAVLGAFNPAFAGGDSAYHKDSSVGASADTDITAGANISPGVNVGSSGDQSVSSGLSASQSSTDSKLPSNAELSAAAIASTTEAPDSGEKRSLN